MLPKGVSKLLVPPWCLEIVLAALKKPPFQPLYTHGKIDFKFLTLKTVFLVANTAGRWVSEIQNLCWEEPYIRFTVSKGILMTNVEFLPKVASQWHINQPLELPVMGQELDYGLWKLCVDRF